MPEGKDVSQIPQKIKKLKARTGEKWLKAVELAKKGATAKDFKEAGITRTYAYEARQLIKAEKEAVEKPLTSEIEVTEAKVSEKKVPEKPPAKEEEEKPAKEEEEKEEEVELAIIPDEEDCQDLYAIPFETMALIFKDEALEVSEKRIQKQGKRLYKLFQKYKWKLPLMELLFGAGFATDIGTKVMYLWEKRQKEKEESEAGETSKEGSAGESKRTDTTPYEKKRRPT